MTVGKNIILKYAKGDITETRLLQVHRETPTYLKGWDVLRGGWRTFSIDKIRAMKAFGRFNLNR